ncbi:MAG TPA: radical SAM protein [Stellaceae bacterium]|nr:radical SAM protein [Stellaceae bacterium]
MQGFAQKCRGWIDGVNGASVTGWAYDPRSEGPIDVTAFYRGEEYGKVKADGYRPDLEQAGIGLGHHAFTLPLPCPPEEFEPSALEVRFRDETPLGRSNRFLSWCFSPPHNAAVQIPPDLDLLFSPTTRTFHLELTNRCNLRCVYCAVSQPDYTGQDMKTEDFEALVRALRSRCVETIVVNGHGETTMIPGWHHQILALARAGFRLQIITNFARLLSDEELEAMAHISVVQVSVDTHRPEVLRKIRRRVDLGNILLNMFGVRSKAKSLRLPQPELSWSCVVTDLVAMDIVDYVRFGLSCGVRRFTFCNLTKYPDIEGAENVQHVTTMPSDKLIRFAALFEEARQLIERAGGGSFVQAGLLDTIEREIHSRRAA